MYNISTSNFKNLIFKAGPNINPEIVSMENEDLLNYHRDNFNASFSHTGMA
jgi:hypothetical protein